MDDDDNEYRKEKIRRKGGEKLCQGLRPPCPGWPQAEPYSDWHPDQARQDHEDDDPQQCHEAQQGRFGQIGPGQLGGGEGKGPPTGPSYETAYQNDPENVDCSGTGFM